MLARILLILALSLVIVSAPVSAAGSAQIPEADSMTLFALGLLGLIVGRRAAMRSRRDTDPED